jgi:hypothetical protein
MTTKKQLTPEQRAMLNEIVNGAFSSIAIHFIGDNLAKGIHYAADATQRTVCFRQACVAQDIGLILDGFGATTCR